MQAWETSFETSQREARAAEIAAMRELNTWRILTNVFWSATPMVVGLVTFATYVGVMGQRLDVATALTSLALLEIMRFPLNNLPNVINAIIEARVSIDRLQVRRR